MKLLTRTWQNSTAVFVNFSMGKSGKKANWGSTPQVQKIPKFTNPNTSKTVPEQFPPSYNETPKWSLLRLDVDGVDGKWGWRGIPQTNLWDILEKLRNYESMKWSEIEANYKRDHATDVSALHKDARSRLVALKLHDEETLFRFRLQGKVRIWGRKRGAVFELLWYDPEHEICPSSLAHT